MPIFSLNFYPPKISMFFPLIKFTSVSIFQPSKNFIILYFILVHLYLFSVILYKSLATFSFNKMNVNKVRFSFFSYPLKNTAICSFKMFDQWELLLLRYTAYYDTILLTSQPLQSSLNLYWILQKFGYIDTFLHQQYHNNETLLWFFYWI